MDDLAPWTGWLGAALIVAAALVPLGHRIFARARAAPTSRTITSHLVLGFAATAMALLHALAALPALGSPAAIGGGMKALVPAAAAFFVLFAHVGVGLRLRNPRLRGRARIRRWHVALALTIAATVTVHVSVILLAS